MSVYKGEQFAMAKSYLNHSAILTFMIANGLVIDNEADANRAMDQFCSDMSESYAEAERDRAKKEAEHKAAKQKALIGAKRSQLLTLTATKSDAVKRLDDSIKDIVASIPDAERTDAERALLTVDVSDKAEAEPVASKRKRS